jgi:hypothetical protein
MAAQAPDGLLGIQTNMPATVPPDIAKALADGEPAPAGLSEDEKAAYEQMNALYTKGAGYALMMVTRLQTLGYALTDSPVSLAAWYYDKFADWTYSGGDPAKSLTKDEMLDDISLLVHRDGHVWRAALLGEQRQQLQRRRHQDSGRDHRLSRQDLPSSEKLGREGVPQRHLLQQSRQGRPLRRLGATRPFLIGAACGVQNAALTLY